MRWNDRPVDNSFDPEEVLYHRFNRHMLETGDDPDRYFLNVRVPDTSVNRSKPDGRPDDVLLVDHPKYKDWGIVAFPVRDIPSPHIREAGKDLHYRVQHDPEDKNFYHSEIRAFADAQCSQRKKNTKPTCKTWFRMELSERLSRKNILRSARV